MLTNTTRRDFDVIEHADRVGKDDEIEGPFDRFQKPVIFDITEPEIELRVFLLSNFKRLL